MRLSDDAALGADLKIKNENITALINLFSDLNFSNLQENDVIGDIYEYLIGMFAKESGTKAGEFYTPHYVSQLITNIVSVSTPQICAIYDPAVGSGSLLLKIRNYLSDDDSKNLHFYGQEKNTTTFNLCRMNLLLHDVRPECMDIRNGDTLGEDWPEDPRAPGQGILFDAVVMNPPYSLKNWNKSGIRKTDPRFEYIGGLMPPDNKGDYAFLIHGLYHLNSHGTMGIVLPHGVLFRGAAEGEIRKKLIDKNLIDGIIGLPAGMFTNTGIPVLVMILRKNRGTADPVLIIDASTQFEKSGKQNILLEKHLAKITDAYLARQEIPHFCHPASREEIVSNDYNLNIPRYVEPVPSDKFPEDVDAHLQGGLPLRDLEQLQILNRLFPDFIGVHFSEIRPHYYMPKNDFNHIKHSVLSAEILTRKKAELHTSLNAFCAQYWDIFTNWSDQQAQVQEKKSMLQDIKNLLADFSFIDVYDGYQTVSDLWKDTLNGDLQYIAENGFYQAARLQLPHLVNKGSGSKKHQEQDGLMSALVPTNLIVSELMGEQRTKISALNDELVALNASIEELISDNSLDNDGEAMLSDYFKDDSNELDRKKVKAGLKNAPKNSPEYTLLKKVDDLCTEISVKAKTIKTEQNALKIACEEIIPHLTENEIDLLMKKKWFGDILDKIEDLLLKPVTSELNDLKGLIEKYSFTITDLDSQIQALDANLDLLVKDLEVTHE